MDIEVMSKTKIMVMGVGNGGNNAVDRMITDRLENVEFVSVDTDINSLNKMKAVRRLQLGEKLMRGLVESLNPEFGRLAAEETRDAINKILIGTDMLFIVAGMGGGTGTGAAPVIAGIARELGILTVGVVTKPLRFEGEMRMRNALEGIGELCKNVDTLVVIPNDKLTETANGDLSLTDFYCMMNGVLCQCIQGISDLITKDNPIQLDFIDIKSFMQNQGLVQMGIGRSSDNYKAEIAAEMAVKSPLLESTVSDARSVLINISGGSGVTLRDVTSAARIVKSFVEHDASIIFGATTNDGLKDEIMVTVFFGWHNAFHYALE